MAFLFEARWSPYLVGVGIGVLCWLTFLLSDKPLGCSTAFARTSGMIENLVSGKKATERPYFKEFLPVVDWEWMLVLGIVIGAFLSSTMSGVFFSWPGSLPMEQYLWSHGISPTCSCF